MSNPNTPIWRESNQLRDEIKDLEARIEAMVADLQAHNAKLAARREQRNKVLRKLKGAET